jgi:hypothetical protein
VVFIVWGWGSLAGLCFACDGDWGVSIRTGNGCIASSVVVPYGVEHPCWQYIKISRRRKKHLSGGMRAEHEGSLMRLS